MKLGMISLCMITKNEEDCIKQALDSVKDLVKEIILVDTGSSDKTKEIAGKYTSSVFDFKWIDDFSAARNFSLEKATQPWILVLDADEIISKEDHEAIRELVKDDSIYGYSLIQRNYTNEKTLPGIVPNKKDYTESKDYFGYCENPLVRIFKNDKRIKFVNKVHEIVEPSIIKIHGKMGRTNIPIHHYGWDKPSNKLKDKKGLYLHISERQIILDPRNPRYYYDAAKIYRALNNLPKAELYFKKVIKLDPKYRNPFFNLGEIYQSQGMLNDAILCYKKAINLDPGDTNPHVNLAVIFIQRGKLSVAEILLRKAIEINKNNVAAYDNLIAVYIKLKAGGKAKEIAKKAYEVTKLDKFSDAIKTIGKHIK